MHKCVVITKTSCCQTCMFTVGASPSQKEMRHTLHYFSINIVNVSVRTLLAQCCQVPLKHNKTNVHRS